MTRQLRNDTYAKQVGHHFREIIGHGSEHIRFKIVTDSVVKANIKGFAEVENNFIAMVIKGKTPEKTKICMTNVFGLMDTSIKSAQKHARNMASDFQGKNISNGLNRLALNLSEVALLYAEIAKVEANPVRISLPHNFNGEFEIQYPQVKINGNNNAETAIWKSKFGHSITIKNSFQELKQNSKAIKRLRGHCLDRTYMSKLAHIILSQFPNFDENLKKLISKQEIDLGLFKIANYCEEIKVNVSTWEQDGHWIEYKEGFFSFRGIILPESILTSLHKKSINDVVEGVPYVGSSIIVKASNPKSYVMINRPRDDTGRNDAPTLRLKIENQIKSMRKFNIEWNGESPEHRAIKDNDSYIQTLTGPFATKDAQKNLHILMEIAQQKGLL